MSTIWTSGSIENKHNVYRDEDCMKKFCEFSREHAIKIINFEKKKIVLLTSEQKFKHNYTYDESYHKVNDYCNYTGKYRGTAHSISNLKCCIPKEITVVFHKLLLSFYH